MSRARLGFALVLVALGAGWGLSQPLGKIAVSQGYRPLGIIFWQFSIGAVLLGAVSHARGRSFPRGPGPLRFCLAIALIGTLLPNFASLTAIRVLPAGIVSISLSLVPILAFPIALAMGTDRFGWLRLAGLCLGLAGVALIALPRASLPEPAMVLMLPVALIAPAFYAVEGNVVARWGMHGLDPVQVLYGASVIGAAIALPVVLISGQWIDPRPPWHLPDLAIALASTLHAATYAGYVWLVSRAGAVFAMQVSYLITGFGLLWARVFFAESYSGWVWAAVALMFAGLALVQPRDTAPLAESARLKHDAG